MGSHSEPSRHQFEPTEKKNGCPFPRNRFVGTSHAHDSITKGFDLSQNVAPTMSHTSSAGGAMFAQSFCYRTLKTDYGGGFLRLGRPMGAASTP